MKVFEIRADWTGSAWNYPSQPIDASGKECLGSTFRDGRRWDLENRLFSEKIWPGKVGTFVQGGRGEFFVERSLMGTLQAAIPKDKLQAVPVTIHGSNLEYQILNALDIIDCVDEEMSDFELHPSDFPNPHLVGHYRSFNPLCLDARKCAGHHLFRIERYLMCLVCSLSIHDLLLSNNVTGIEFHPIKLSHFDELNQH